MPVDGAPIKLKNKNIKLLSNEGNYNEIDNRTRLYNQHLGIEYKYLKPIGERVPNEWLTMDENFILFIVVNLPLVGSDFVMEPEMGFDDGYTTIVMVREGITKIELVKFIMQCSQGVLLKNPYVEFIKARAFRLEPHDLIRGNLMIDGETVPYGPIQGEVLPQWARVFTRLRSNQ